MLIVGHISKAAANLATVRVGLERERLSGFDEGCRVGVNEKLIEEDCAGQEEGSLEI